MAAGGVDMYERGARLRRPGVLGIAIREYLHLYLFARRPLELFSPRALFCRSRDMPRSITGAAVRLNMESIEVVAEASPTPPTVATTAELEVLRQQLTAEFADLRESLQSDFDLLRKDLVALHAPKSKKKKAPNLLLFTKHLNREDLCFAAHLAELAYLTRSGNVVATSGAGEDADIQGYLDLRDNNGFSVDDWARLRRLAVNEEELPEEESPAGAIDLRPLGEVLSPVLEVDEEVEEAEVAILVAPVPAPAASAAAAPDTDAAVTVAEEAATVAEEAATVAAVYEAIDESNGGSGGAGASGEAIIEVDAHVVSSPSSPVLPPAAKGTGIQGEGEEEDGEYAALLGLTPTKPIASAVAEEEPESGWLSGLATAAPPTAVESAAPSARGEPGALGAVKDTVVTVAERTSELVGNTTSAVVHVTASAVSGTASAATSAVVGTANAATSVVVGAAGVVAGAADDTVARVSTMLPLCGETIVEVPFQPSTTLERAVHEHLKEHPGWSVGTTMRVCELLRGHPDLELVAHEESHRDTLDGQVAVWRSAAQKRIFVTWRGTDSLVDAKQDAESMMLVPYLEDDTSGLRVGVGFHNQYTGETLHQRVNAWVAAELSKRGREAWSLFITGRTRGPPPPQRVHSPPAPTVQASTTRLTIFGRRRCRCMCRLPGRGAVHSECIRVGTQASHAQGDLGDLWLTPRRQQADGRRAEAPAKYARLPCRQQHRCRHPRPPHLLWLPTRRPHHLAT